MPPKIFKLSLIPLALCSLHAQADGTAPSSEELETVYVTAERKLQQQLGVSRINRTDIEKRPAANDLSELIRTMPGVNLTGNAATGQRGNKRQIDIRGMGPENTLILIDGKPVTSRNAERMGMRGERNTRGDSNWVPVEAVESISVIRGPAAARYGSGAMGGVVNIVTKKITNDFSGSVTYYTNQPQDSREGATQRIGFVLSGPIVKDRLSFRLYGNVNKTEADANDINAGVDGRGLAAGVEGVRNRDIAGRLHWSISPEHSLTLDGSFSRQGNIYNGDTLNSNNTGITSQLLRNGVEETSRLYRRAYSLTYNGTFGWGENKTWLSYDETKNSRFPDNMAGGPEGSYSSDKFTDSRLKNTRLSTEFHIPFNAAGSHVLTAGAELGRSSLDDPYTMSYTGRGTGNPIPGRRTDDSHMAENRWAVFAEDHWTVREKTHLIPFLRYDHSSLSGGNVSGGLNFEQGIGANWRIKGGIARAYKAPSLYQTHPSYLIATRGKGCPIVAGFPTTGACYYLGNANLKPETALNKELGFEFAKDGWSASMAYFHNAYRNKIIIGRTLIGTVAPNTNVLQWENSPTATVSGFEGNITVPLHRTLKWSNNFTYMQKSEDADGNPLSLIPKYTLNSTLNWTPNEKWDANLTFTHYGRTKPRGVVIVRHERPIEDGLDSTQLGSYGLWGINAGYNWNSRVNVRLGISNLFDKQIYRSGRGANVYNEHGRAFYGSLKVSF